MIVIKEENEEIKKRVEKIMLNFNYKHKNKAVLFALFNFDKVVYMDEKIKALNQEKKEIENECLELKKQLMFLNKKIKAHLL